MPHPNDTHHRNNVMKNIFQLKKNSAATAPTWKRAMKIAVTQLMPCLAFLPYISIRSPLLMMCCLYDSRLTRKHQDECNSCVIAAWRSRYRNKGQCQSDRARCPATESLQSTALVFIDP